MFGDSLAKGDEKNAIAVSDMNELQLAARAKLMNQYYELRGMNLPVAQVSDQKAPPKKKKKSKKKKS